MMIQLIRARGRMPEGHTYDPGDGVGNLLIRIGAARYATTAPADSKPRHQSHGRHRRGRSRF